MSLGRRKQKQIHSAYVREAHGSLNFFFVSFDLVKSNLGKNVEWLRDIHTICQLLGFGGYQERRKKRTHCRHYIIKSR